MKENKKKVNKGYYNHDNGNVCKASNHNTLVAPTATVVSSGGKVLVAQVSLAVTHVDRLQDGEDQNLDDADGDDCNEGGDDDKVVVNTHPSLLQGVGLALHIGQVGLQRTIAQHHHLAVLRGLCMCFLLMS